jgi:hypothetical protein
MNNREKLIDFMAEYQIDRREVADLVCTDRDTVDRWLLSRESSRHLEMPDMAIELLRLKLAGRDRPLV